MATILDFFTEGMNLLDMRADCTGMVEEAITRAYTELSTSALSGELRVRLDLSRREVLTTARLIVGTELAYATDQQAHPRAEQLGEVHAVLTLAVQREDRAHEWLAALSDDDLQQEYTLTDDEGGDTEEIMDEMTRRGMIPAMPEFKPHRGDNGISLADDDAWPQGKVNEMYLLINGAWTVARYHTLAQVFFHDAPEVHTRDDAEAALKRYFEQVWSAYRAECAGR